VLFEPFRLDGEVPHIQAAIENQSRIRGIARTWQCCCHKLAAGVQSEEGACLGKKARNYLSWLLLTWPPEVLSPAKTKDSTIETHRDSGGTD